MALAIPPINYESQVVETNHYGNLFNSGNDCNSKVIMQAYAKEIPFVVVKNKSKKLEKLRKAGLIGCLNDSGLTSINYKDELYKND